MKLYRYVNHCVCSLDEFGDICSSRVRIYLLEYTVTKETPMGYWINEYSPRWVSKTSRKRFAHDSKDDAWDSFKARKKRQIAILSRRLDDAKAADSMDRPS